MILTSSIILGFVRLCFLLLFLFYLNKRFVNKSASNNFLEFFVNQWFKYGSIIAIVIFITVQLSIYDLLNCIIILSVIIGVDYIGMRNLKNFRQYFNNAIKKNTNKILKHVELKRPAFSWFGFKNKGTLNSSIFTIIVLLILVAVTFGSRFYFFKYDLYSLSSGWIADLEKVIDFDSQIWFLKDTAVAGDLIFVNFYAKITDVSPEIALQSMGILESTLLSILLFWVIRKITPSKSMAPMIAAMSFALAYTLTPVNIYFLLQNKPIFLGLAFALPAMVYLLRPNLLKFRKLHYFISMLLVFITIGLIDLFTMLILMPPFLVIAAVFTRAKSRKYFWLGALGYLSALLSLGAIYGSICLYFETDLSIFIHANLLSVSSYTYIPQLVVPFTTLQDYYQWSTFGGMVILLFFMLFKKEKNWSAAFAFLLYFNFLILLVHVNSTWLDGDLLNQALSVFMPIVAGINAAVVINLFKPIFSRLEVLNKFAVAALFVGILFSAVYYQKDTIAKLETSSTTPKQILDAYDKISTTYFPLSYEVVNDESTQVISTNKHFFMNYSEFLEEYPKQDSIYFKNIDDPKFLKNNPQRVLPKSILLFVYPDNEEMYGENGDISSQLMNQLVMLKKRGRTIELFYNNDDVKVYEIINSPNESKISDLIF